MSARTLHSCCRWPRNKRFQVLSVMHPSAWSVTASRQLLVATSAQKDTACSTPDCSHVAKFSGRARRGVSEGGFLPWSWLHWDLRRLPCVLTPRFPPPSSATRRRPSYVRPRPTMRPALMSPTAHPGFGYWVPTEVVRRGSRCVLRTWPHRECPNCHTRSATGFRELQVGSSIDLDPLRADVSKSHVAVRFAPFENEQLTRPGGWAHARRHAAPDRQGDAVSDRRTDSHPGPPVRPAVRPHDYVCGADRNARRGDRVATLGECRPTARADHRFRVN